jgi:hypothetical protein
MEGQSHWPHPEYELFPKHIIEGKIEGEIEGEHKEEEVSSYRMTLRKREDTGN